MNGSAVGFFEATPRILAASIKGAVGRAENAHRSAAWLAWTTAALGRVDKMPALESMMNRSPRQPPRRQTWEEQLAIATMIVAQAGD